MPLTSLSSQTEGEHSMYTSINLSSPITLRASSLFSLNGLIRETQTGLSTEKSFARLVVFLLFSFIPSLEKSFDDGFVL